MSAKPRSKQGILTELFGNFGFVCEDSSRPYSLVSGKMVDFRKNFIQTVLSALSTHISFPIDDYQDHVVQLCASQFLEQFHGVFPTLGSDYTGQSSLKYPDDSKKIVDILAKIFCAQEKFHQKNLDCGRRKEAKADSSARDLDREMEVDDDEDDTSIPISSKRKRRPTRKCFSSDEESDTYNTSRRNSRKKSEKTSDSYLQDNIDDSLNFSYPLDGSQDDGTECVWLLESGSHWPANLQPFTFRYMHEHEAYELGGTTHVQEFVLALKNQVRLPSKLMPDDEKRITRKCKKFMSRWIKIWIECGLLLRKDGRVSRHLDLEKQWRIHRSKWLALRHNGVSDNAFELQKPQLLADTNQFSKRPAESVLTCERPCDFMPPMHSKRPKHSHDGITEPLDHGSNCGFAGSSQPSGTETFNSTNQLSTHPNQPNREGTSTSTSSIPILAPAVTAFFNSSGEGTRADLTSTTAPGTPSNTTVSQGPMGEPASSVNTKDTRNQAVASASSSGNLSLNTTENIQPSTDATLSRERITTSPSRKPKPSWARPKDSTKKRKATATERRSSAPRSREAARPTDGPSAFKQDMSRRWVSQFAQTQLETKARSAGVPSGSEEPRRNASMHDRVVSHSTTEQPTQGQLGTDIPIVLQPLPSVAPLSSVSRLSSVSIENSIQPITHAIQSNIDYSAEMNEPRAPTSSPDPAASVIFSMNPPLSSHAEVLSSNLDCATKQAEPGADIPHMEMEYIRQPSGPASSPPTPPEVSHFNMDDITEQVELDAELASQEMADIRQTSVSAALRASSFSLDDATEQAGPGTNIDPTKMEYVMENPLSTPLKASSSSLDDLTRQAEPKADIDPAETEVVRQLSLSARPEASFSNLNNGTKKTESEADMTAIEIEDMRQPSVSVAPEDRPDAASMRSGATANNTAAESLKITFPEFINRERNPYSVMGEHLPRPEESSNAIVRFQASPPQQQTPPRPHKPVLKLIVERSPGEMDSLNFIPEEALGTDSLAEFFAQVTRRRASPDSFVRDLKLTQRWGARASFCVDRLTAEDTWRRIRGDIKRGFTLFSEKHPRKRHFEVFISVGCDDDVLSDEEVEEY